MARKELASINVPERLLIVQAWDQGNKDAIATKRFVIRGWVLTQSLKTT